MSFQSFGYPTYSRQAIFARGQKSPAPEVPDVACNSKNRVTTYLPWIVIGAPPEALDRDFVMSIIRHAKRCQICEKWIRDNLHFKNGAEFEKFMRFCWRRA